MTTRDLAEDLRVAHAPVWILGPADFVRRQEIVALLRTLPHELDSSERRHVAMIRASFVDAGDYVALLSTRSEDAWVLGEVRHVDGRLYLVEPHGDRRTFEVDLKVRSEGPVTEGARCFGRTSTDRAGYPVGPVVYLEPLAQGGSRG